MSLKDVYSLTEVCSETKDKIKKVILNNMAELVKNIEDANMLIEHFRVDDEDHKKVKVFILNNLGTLVKNTEDAKAILGWFPGSDEIMTDFLAKNWRMFNRPSPEALAAKRNCANTAATTDISMQLLGILIATAGCAIMTLTLVLLTAAFFGTAALVIAGIGVATTTGGIGLFAGGTYKNRQMVAAEPGIAAQPSLS